MTTTPDKRDGWLVVLYVLLLLAGLVLLALGLVETARGRGGALVGIGVLAVLIPAALYPIAAAAAAPKPSADAKTLELLESINQRLLVSDSAKRIAYREQDRNALRQAIRTDIDRSDFDAALVLVKDMANDYGYREEAETFRQEILTARQADTDAKIDQALAALDQLMQEHKWHAAAEVAAKVMRLYPESPRVADLDVRVREARLRYKQDLETRFLQAAERNEVDPAMELLKELDAYLSPDETERLREVARGVISKKRENLGIQFKMAVHDKEQSAIFRIGEQIIREFPNTRMADEVRLIIDRLRQRASENAPL